MKAAIIAGGRANRLGALAAKLPKALLPVGGHPLLDYGMKLLRRYGVDEAVICTGHLAEKIEDYVGNESKWGLKIRFSHEDSPLGTAGCLRTIQPPLTEDFLVIYSDVLVEMDLEALVAAHRDAGADATLVVHPNSHPYDSDLVDMDPATRWIRTIHKKPHPKRAWLPNLVSAAVYVLKPRVINLLTPGERADCAHDLLPRALAKGMRILGYPTAEYLKDAGTPERLAEVEEDLRSGRVAGSHRSRPRRAVFLDRDGVINREVNLLHDPDQLELLPGAATAIRRLNRAGWLTIVVTNQPVVARGLCSEEQLRLIHHKLETLLGAEHAYLDSIYYCPHHPDRGYPGENAAYKIPCQCRKPAIGMIVEAVKDFNIDLTGSWLIGDTTSDVQTGANCGVKTILVKTGYGGNDGKCPVSPTHVSADLEAAVEWLLSL